MCRQQILTVEYVDNNKRRLRLYKSTGTLKRTERDLFVRICESEAEVTNNNKTHIAARGIVGLLLKLTSDRHSRAASLRQQSFLCYYAPAP